MGGARVLKRLKRTVCTLRPLLGKVARIAMTAAAHPQLRWHGRTVSFKAE